jgi:hypothetical protein
MVRHLRVGFTVGHWVTNVRTLSEKAGEHNARRVNCGWTRGEYATRRKLLKVHGLSAGATRIGASFAQSLL